MTQDELKRMEAEAEALVKAQNKFTSAERIEFESLKNEVRHLKWVIGVLRAQISQIEKVNLEMNLDIMRAARNFVHYLPRDERDSRE